MHSARLNGRHTLPDGSTVDVTVDGSTAELRGTDTRGEASFTSTLAVSVAALLLKDAAMIGAAA